ncbi:amino acid/amide ABC transporter substrate-binding protein, HAAT family [Micromonospora pattaloongensis]|uniref:Amino acid/amide ABC transporter substrate-binding protein, HAAT family n=1 Tax=Micromonospora pattaloongensis TaxID=405436 RepID=A0A1H3IC28_9ACTN|nr:ABC transporter substrate-binding protein [Micromonospora pattaloongensis]SDY24464.1 amino acid/amide ABC transporter substrate-binding protein, HAAT family [Micromonospora pattaloongensis]
MLMRRGSRNAALAACASFLFTVAVTGCGSDDPGNAVAPPAVRLYGTDGNMGNSFGAEFTDQAGLLAGMKGTTPLTPLSEDFKTRLRSVAPKLGDVVYAAETYDAVVISALAAQLAGEVTPARIAEQINGVTTAGTQCDTVGDCLRLARSGADIEYRGVSLKRGGFTDAGEPSTATFATLHFDTNNQINDGKTEFVGAGNEADTTRKRPPAAERQRPNNRSEQPLTIGGLLPKTGDLAILYPPLAAGAALAIKEINSEGGVLGRKVQWVDGDDGTRPDVAKATVREHVAAGVHVIIGPGASGIARAVLPDVVAAGVVLFSPCNTDAGLSTVEDKGLYFRTAPSDLLQARALADVILRDGSQRVAIVARKDSYGDGLQSSVRTELERTGIAADQLKLLSYEPPAGPATPLDFSAGAAELKNFRPDAVVLIGFGESAQVIKALAAAGVTLRH